MWKWRRAMWATAWVAMTGLMSACGGGDPVTESEAQAAGTEQQITQEKLATAQPEETSVQELVDQTAAENEGRMQAASTTTSSRVVVLTAVTTAYVDKDNPKTAYHKVSTDKLSKTRYRAYAQFPALTLGANESITAVSAVVSPTGGTYKTSTGIVAAAVSWSGSKLTYNTKPAAGGALNAPVKAVVGQSAIIPLNASVFSKVSSTGLSLQLTHSTADTTVNIAGTGSSRPTLRVTVTTTSSWNTGTVSAVSPTLVAPSGAVTYPAAGAEIGAPVKTAGMTGKLVLAHYVPFFPLSFNNEPRGQDYYLTQYTTANPTAPGELVHKPYGGFLRDRPIPVDPRTGDYQLYNFQVEVAQAKAAGLDGFAMDILTFDPTNSVGVNQIKMLQAAQAVGGFKIMLQPDMNGLAELSQAEFVSKLAAMAKGYPSVYRNSAGKVVISPFRAEAKSVAWWKQTIDQMKAAGVDVSLLPLFVDPSKRTSEWDAISDGYADWGGRSPGHLWSGAAKAHAAGKLWMQAIAAQDVRYRTWTDPETGQIYQNTYYEAGNSDTLRESWLKALNDGQGHAADIAVLITWNDYSETTALAPSVHQGWSLLDISSPYIARFKSGAYKEQYDNEAIFLSHRNQRTDATTFTHPYKSVPRSSVETAPDRNQVEVLTMLNAPATVHLSVGGKAYSYAAPAGISVAKVALETEASVSAEFVRNGVRVGSVTTKERVQAAPVRQDLGYWFASSARLLPPRQ